MDIRQLRYFLAIAREGQITRAAKFLNMEQPPLSRQLKQIEEELGVSLFERSGKTMHLTQAGKVLEKKAQFLLQHLEETLTEIQDIDAGLQGTLSIGSVFSCVSLLPAKIRDFRSQYPHTTFKILEGDHFILGQYLEDRIIELGVTRLPFEYSHEINKYSIAPLPADPFVLVIPSSWNENYPQPSIHLQEIVNIPLLAFKSDKTIRLNEKLMHEFKSTGSEPNFIGECSSVSIIVSLVAAGIGATILPKSVMSSFPIPQISMLDIVDTALQSEVGVIWLKDRYLSKCGQRFIELLQHT